jgi:hypothetical protein
MSHGTRRCLCLAAISTSYDVSIPEKIVEARLRYPERLGDGGVAFFERSRGIPAQLIPGNFETTQSKPQ